MKESRIFLILLAWTIALSGCLPAPGNQVQQTPQAEMTSFPVDTITPGLTPSMGAYPAEGTKPVQEATMTAEETMQKMISLAKASLAQKLGVSDDSISLAGAEHTLWSDSSLGCPRKGVMYLQVITPGYTISLEAGGQVYIYHTDETQNIVFCPAVLPDGSVGTIEIPPPIR